MATCLETVANAMRMSKVLGIGKEPKAAEAELGMSCLQGLYDMWLTNNMFGRLTDVYLTADDTAEEGKRYYIPLGITLTAATSSIVDPDGNTRQPRDLSCYETLTSTGTRAVKLYDRTAWVNLLDLGLSDIAPLSGRGATGLAAALASYGALAAAFGADPGPQVGVLAATFMAGLSYKTGSTRDKIKAEYF
jgi:hypothetical protein